MHTRLVGLGVLAFAVACGPNADHGDPGTDGGANSPGNGAGNSVGAPIAGVCATSQPTAQLSHDCIVPGTRLTISGSGFGTKPQAAPVVWDDFEGGAIDAPLATGGWQHYGAATYPRFTARDAYAGRQAAFTDMPPAADNFNTAGRMGLNTTSAYFSYQFRVEVVAGSFATDGAFIKLLRANAAPNFYHPQPRFYTTVFPRADAQIDSGYDDLAGSVSVKGEGPHRLRMDAWNRLEAYYRYSDPGIANGALLTWVNLQPNAAFENALTRTSASATAVLDSFLLPLMADRLSNLHLRVYVDDVYVDTTRARVEIGDAPQWANCTRRELQIPEAWSPTEIRVRVHQGRLANGSTAYVYVVDASGAVINGSGIPVRFGS